MTPRAQRWLGRLTEPYVLFPLLTVLLLGLLWATTLERIAQQADATRHGAKVSTQELTETYEAQVVRALREIDLTLKVVKARYETTPASDVLPTLKARELLPPELLFTVSLTDATGAVISSIPPAAESSIAGHDFFESLRTDGEGLVVAKPAVGADANQWRLRFGRRLEAPDGEFAGAAIVAVDAAYFVSGYEQSKLGQDGALGLLGIDGVFRVLRSADTVTSGQAIDYAPFLEAAGSEEVIRSPWDAVRRYVGARPLFDFPLTVVVGLSEAEQLAPAALDRRESLSWAGGGSLLILIIMAVLGRSSVQLARSQRLRAAEQMANAERIEYLAYHDALTGLPNRSLFSKLLNEAIEQAGLYQRMLAVLFLDLDRFKHINDTLGHEAGDELLRTVASRLRSCVRETDTVARLGGDEFVVLLPELGHDRIVATVAEKILSAVSRPFMLLGQEFRVTASIGGSIYPRDGRDEQTLKKNADIAMYLAKAEGKNNFQFYSPKLDTESLERLTLESSLRHALERNEFELHYQAKRDMRSEAISGMEALLRWRHPDLGLIAPMQFINVADETGLIVAIGKWVFRTACMQNVAWQKAGLPRLVVAVNLTARQFTDENLLSDLTSVLAQTGMEPQLLELEITEGMLMHNVERTLHTLAGIKRLGVRIAIDDFGLGYASLAALQQFPLDTIKIDRSFIRSVDTEIQNAEMAEAIIAVGRSLSLTVVAQGVETREQADFLRLHACDELQGFYFNRPVSAEEFAVLLQPPDVPSEPLRAHGS